MRNSEQRSALITGASKGLGFALAEHLARAGYRLVIDARTKTDLRVAADRLAVHTQVVAIAGDVADADHRRSLARAVGERLSLLVLNASALGPTPLPLLAGFDLPELRRVFEVNVFAPLALAQATLPALRCAEGVVITLSSDAAVEGYPGWGGYGASKAALDQLARVLAAEEDAVRVYAVDPGDLRTDMHFAAIPDADPDELLDPVAVPPMLQPLLTGALPSGRYRAADLPATATA
jgi:NAD(P)-dependent dehydrogenase (short-subunit alcohol dehydrogenase family)